MVGIAKDGVEITIDGILKEGLLKEIPVVNTLTACIKTGRTIKDFLFMKKVLSFLHGIKDVAPDKRAEMIDEIDSSDEYKIKVGEKILYILDSCEDYEKAGNIAFFFKVYLQGKISYDDFIRGSSIINRITTADLREFALSKENKIEDTTLMGAGLTYIDYYPPEFVKGETFYIEQLEEGHEEPDKIEGGNIVIELTEIGRLIRKYFKPVFFKEQKNNN